MLNEKQKKPFVLLNGKVMEAWHLPPALLFILLHYSFSIAWLAQANKTLDGLYLGLFCCDIGLI